MAQETVIDTLITEYGFRTDKRSLRQLDARIDRIRNRLNSVSRGFTVAGGVMTGVLFGVGRGMVEFDREMNRLQRDTNATEAEMAAMRDRVIELGSSSDYTTISVTDAARALRELRKGGLDFEQGMAALPAVLNLVAATEIDVGEAATKTAKIMKGFGLEVEDIPRIHDLIAHAQVTTGITAAEMIDTLLRVAPTARSAKLSIEEMVASLAILVDQGQISERAATSLERTLVQLSKAEVLPPEAKKAIKELGVNIKTVQDLMAQGKFIDALKLLAEAGLDVSTASRIFGEDGQRAALTLAAEIPRLESFRGGLDDIEGSMKKQADTMNRGLSGAWAAFISSLSAARESLGDAGLRLWLENAANAVRGLVEKFTALPEPTRRFVGMLLASGPALLLAAGGLRTISFLLGGLAPAIRGTNWLLKTFWGTAAAPGLAVRGFAVLRAAGVGAMIAIRRAKRRLDLAIAFGEPWALAAAGVRRFKVAALRSFAAIGTGWATLKTALTWGAVRGVIVAGFGTISAVGVAAWGAIGTAATAALTVMTGGTIWIVIGIIAALAAVAALLVAAWHPVSTFFVGLWRGLRIGSRRVGEAFGRLLDAMGPVGEGIRAVGSGIVGVFNWIREAVGAVWSWLTGLFGDETRLGRDWAASIIDGAVTAIDFLTSMVEIIKSVILWIGRIPSGVGGWISGFFGGDDDGEEGTERGRFFGGPLDGPASLLAAPAGPPALSAAAAGGSSQTINRSTSVNVERIDINAEGGDPDTIASQVGDSLREQLHNTAEDFDSDVVR